jgi:hypothetical protein
MTHSDNPSTSQEKEMLLAWETPRLLRLNSPDTSAGTLGVCVEGYHGTCACICCGTSIYASNPTGTTGTGTS